MDFMQIYLKFIASFNKMRDKFSLLLSKVLSTSVARARCAGSRRWLAGAGGAAAVRGR